MVNQGEWDANYNRTAISDAEAQALEQRERESQWAIEARRRELARHEFELPWISDADVRARFAHYTNAEIPHQPWHTHVGQYTANRPMWVCHHCGCMGYKQTFRRKFKCYYCHTRDVTIIRAGDISNAVRILGAGVHMQTVWDARPRIGRRHNANR